MTKGPQTARVAGCALAVCCALAGADAGCAADIEVTGPPQSVAGPLADVPGAVDATALRRLDELDGPVAACPNGCDDGDPCTSDACTEGACGHAPAMCADGNACTQDYCAPQLGCRNDPAPRHGLPCDDGNACVSGELCAAGKCAPGKAISCNDGNACTSDACDPAAGCRHAAVPAGTPCADGLPCSAGDACAAGVCHAGIDCCACDTDTDCADDGDLCNGVPVCVAAGGCRSCAVPNAVVTCASPGPCQTAACDPATGKCVAAKAPDGLACGPQGDLCAGISSCVAGACLPGPKKVCNDANPCTDDACTPAQGCVFLPNAAPCDDGKACTTEVCKAGLCHATAVTCAAYANCVEPGGCQCAPFFAGDGQTCVCATGTVPTDVDGTTVCPPEYPSWGLGPESPTGLTDNGDGTISHALTGLTWQKVPETKGHSWAAAKQYCNALALGGKADWRLPTLAELLSIWDYGKGMVYPSKRYWSASLVAKSASKAWSFDEFSAFSLVALFVALEVRCVRGLPILKAAMPRFELAPGGVAYDTATGRTWQREAPMTYLTKSDAETYCATNQAKLPGTGWRLPTFREQLSILDVQHAYPALDALVFPDFSFSCPWSASGWNVCYWGYGFVGGGLVESARLRCVR